VSTDDRPPRRPHRDFAGDHLRSGPPTPQPTDWDERDVITPLHDADDTLTPTPAALGKVIDALRAEGRLSAPAHEVAEEIAKTIVPMLLDRMGRSHRITTDRILEVAAAAPSSDRTLVRLAGLETWREDHDKWRARLTGAADSNGRIGNLDRTIAALRHDVGDEAECKAVRETVGAVRAVQRKMVAAIGAAALAGAASAWGLGKSRDENIAAAARAAHRLETIERDLDRIYQRLPFLGPASNPDPRDPP
jgi:hypothetical protein